MACVLNNQTDVFVTGKSDCGSDITDAANIDRIAGKDANCAWNVSWRKGDTGVTLEIGINDICRVTYTIIL